VFTTLKRLWLVSRLLNVFSATMVGLVLHSPALVLYLNMQMVAERRWANAAWGFQGPFGLLLQKRYILNLLTVTAATLECGSHLLTTKARYDFLLTGNVEV
jgi:hypothetical protein